MCDYKSKYDENYKCPHPDYGPGKDEEKTFCIFHSDREDKDAEKFYKEFKKLYKSGKHDFAGFIFPKGFDFEKLRKETRNLEFKEADFGWATFSGKVCFIGTTFSGNTEFIEATFLGEARFWGAKFLGKTSFWKVTFSEISEFDEATFSKEARFGRTTFSGETDFRYARFLGKADFGCATFSESAYFRGVTFSESAYFGEATFSEKADFGEAKFLERTDFGEATFLRDSEFSSTTFSSETGFIKTTFSGETDFKEATFSGEADFVGVKFLGRADFGNAIFSGGTNFEKATFSGGAYFVVTTFSEKIDFVEATFSGEANFVGATFSGEADFGKAIFSREADFRVATFLGVINFGIATFSREGKVQFFGRTFFDDSLVDFRLVNFEHPENVTFDGVDLSRCRFLRTDLLKIKYTKVYWCGRRYKSSSYFGRIKVFDERLQEKGRLIRWPALLIQKTGFWNIPLKFLELFRPKNPPQEDKKIRMYFRDLYFQLLTFLEVAASEKEQNHYEVHRLYNQLIDNYEETNRYHEAGDFFAGMMEMRRRESFEKIRIRIALWFYRLFSLYGERPAFALMWLALLIFVSGLFTLHFGITSVNTDSEISRDIFNLGGLFKPGFWTEYLQALFVSLRVFTFGRVETVYFMSDPIWGPLIQIIETVFGAVFLSLFVLAMNRKFRRMKD